MGMHKVRQALYRGLKCRGASSLRKSGDRSARNFGWNPHNASIRALAIDDGGAMTFACVEARLHSLRKSVLATSVNQNAVCQIRSFLELEENSRRKLGNDNSKSLSGSMNGRGVGTFSTGNTDGNLELHNAGSSKFLSPTFSIPSRSASTSSANTPAVSSVNPTKAAKTTAVVKQKSERSADLQILRTLSAYLWPHDNPDFRRRVLIALGLLIGSKVLNVQVPFLFKYAIDSLSTAVGAGGATAAAAITENPVLFAYLGTPTAVLLGYGIARVGAAACNGTNLASDPNVNQRMCTRIEWHNVVAFCSDVKRVDPEATSSPGNALFSDL